MGYPQEILGLVGEKKFSMKRRKQNGTLDDHQKIFGRLADSFSASVVISCVRYKDYIAASFSNNTWALIDAAIPCVITFGVIIYLIRSAFK